MTQHNLESISNHIPCHKSTGEVKYLFLLSSKRFDKKLQCKRFGQKLLEFKIYLWSTEPSGRSPDMWQDGGDILKTKKMDHHNHSKSEIVIHSIYLQKHNYDEINVFLANFRDYLLSCFCFFYNFFKKIFYKISLCCILLNAFRK